MSEQQEEEETLHHHADANNEEEDYPDHVIDCALIVWKSLQNHFRVLNLSHRSLSTSHMARIIRDIVPLIVQTRGTCTEFVWELNLSHNTFVHVPNGIQWLYRIERLDLSSNHIESLKTDAVDGDKMMMGGDDHNSKFCCHSSVLRQFPLLKHLNLSNNRLQSLQVNDNDVSVHHHVHFTRQQRPVLFPDSLRVLDLSHDELTTVPHDSFTNLKQLVKLNLSHNRLTQVPNSICDLPQLLELELNDNQLVYLPQRMERLNRTLIRLNLTNNMFHMYDVKRIKQNIQVQCTITLQELCQRFIRQHKIHDTAHQLMTDVVPKSVMQVDEDIELENVGMRFRSTKREQQLEQELATCPCCQVQFSKNFTTSVICLGRILAPAVQREVIPIKYECCSFTCAAIMLRHSV